MLVGNLLYAVDACVIKLSSEYLENKAEKI